MDTFFAKSVESLIDEQTDMEYINGLVRKMVSRAVGEKSSEKLVGSPNKPVVSSHLEQGAEDLTASDILKYLLGPETLTKLEEAQREPEIPASCICFLNIVEYAKRFVDNILERAKEVCLLKYGVPVKYRKKPVEVQNIRWPSIEDFTIELGIKKIDEYIQMTFEVEENWLYKINFIAAQSDLSSDVYLYEAVFCIPTPCYPIAQTTVSIYFSCDVSRVKPGECPIDVTYSIESLRETLFPGKTIVNDDMLLRLVYSKLSLFKSLYF
ncbi:hypothetical protein NQ318_014934 [Aromia moschata]|uniref:Uncharacterized protein n=1 Tax=Aromia moschata TaxID=1265417 RepID=A0AAV8XK92_9CUCU|nr:hypothetical protein NQ318_014934 [Aromia moschata]